MSSLRDTLESKFGKGVVASTKVGDNKTIPCIPTGIDMIDNKLFSCGGLPKGKMIEFFGQESSGKTTLALICAAAVQKHGQEVLFVDAEHALNTQWAERFGVSVDELLINQPDSGEQALEVVDAAVKSEKPPGLIIVDSVAALVPQAELNGEMGDSVMGVQARLMSQACRKLTANLNKSNSIIIWINQMREKIGVMFGNPNTTTGGKSLKFYASIRAEIARGDQIKKDDKVVGQKIKIKIIKNKVGPPYVAGELVLNFEGGLDQSEDIIEKLISTGELEKKGAWFLIDNKKIQGKDSLIEYLKVRETNV